MTDAPIFFLPAGLFEIGELYLTPMVLEATGDSCLMSCLGRHVRGDWGMICLKDWRANDTAVRKGGEILSAYPLDQVPSKKGYSENTLWVLTEADRSATTLFLLPEEY